jgi:hypothetical protein
MMQLPVVDKVPRPRHHGTLGAVGTRALWRLKHELGHQYPAVLEDLMERFGVLCKARITEYEELALMFAAWDGKELNKLQVLREKVWLRAREMLALRDERSLWNCESEVPAMIKQHDDGGMYRPRFYYHNMRVGAAALEAEEQAAAHVGGALSPPG